MKKTTLLVIALLAAGTMLTACESELDDKPAAVIEDGEAQDDDEVDEDDDEPVETRELTIDVDESSIGWVGAKVTGDHTGGFTDWTGTAVERDGELDELEFTVDTRSIFSDNDDLTDHLKSDDFFDVEEYPEASFESSRIVEDESDDGTHRITGDFTIRGVTNTVTFPATISAEEEGFHGAAEFTIERFDFGIDYKGQADDLTRDEVLMKIDLTAV